MTEASGRLPDESTLYRHRISADDYDTLLAAQYGRCAICLASEKLLVIDHDHSCCGSTTGYSRTCGNCIRGLVCYRCNNMLGYLDRTPADMLARALQYTCGKNPRKIGVPGSSTHLLEYLVAYLSDDAMEAA